MMKKIDPNQVSTSELHQFILGPVSPRPICFASTVDENGVPNLAPYSFFNAFSSNPPILIFSSNRRVRDNTTKDTLHNVKATGEVVVNIVNYDMVRQAALASIEYPSDVSEFEKSGLTPVPSEMVMPFRVKESKVQYECKVKEVIPLGDQGGAGHLIICEIMLIHIAEEVFDDKGKIDPRKLGNVGRLGRTYYVKTNEENIFSIYQPAANIGIGFDQLPEHIMQSDVLTANDIAHLAALESIPDKHDIEARMEDQDVKDILESGQDTAEALEQYAKRLIENREYQAAFEVLMIR